jgi:multidrug efflux pump subunit AcrA (membrane-fusion protein)
LTVDIAAVTTPAAPVVTTENASGITTSGATLNATVDPEGADTDYYFQYGTTAAMGSTTSASDAGSGTNAIPVSAEISGLTWGTTYYYEVVATNSVGPSDGSEQVFTTSAASQPSVTTEAASGITKSGATLNATVNPNGADTDYYFQYGTTDAFGSTTSSTDVGSGTAAVSVSTGISGLASGKTYDYRVVATNSGGTSYGSEQTFTASAQPTVETGSGSGTTTTTVTLSGTMNPGGVDTTVHFQYGETTGMASRTASIDAGAGTTAVSVSTIVTGLKPDTKYDFRLDATSSLGTVHGVTETFSTAESSCASDKATIAADEQTIARQKLTVEEQSQSVTSTEAGDVTSPATIVQDEATVGADEYTVSTDEQALSATTLTSPIAGTVTALNGSVGETVSGSSSNSSSSSSSASSGATGSSGSPSSSGSSFVTITNLGNLEVVASFAEADISNIAIGDPATVSLAALPDTDLSALVTAVSPTSTVSNNVVTYDVTIAIKDPPSAVKVGMTADVTVITASKTGVLVVPSAAVTTTGTRSTVTVLSHGIQTTQPVVVGLIGSSTTQIVAGLKAGEVVVEPTVSVSSTGTSTSGGTTFTGGGGGGLSLGGFGG